VTLPCKWSHTSGREAEIRVLSFAVAAKLVSFEQKDDNDPANADLDELAKQYDDPDEGNCASVASHASSMC